MKNNNLNPSPFEGPIFIVGLSRSGTKLIRDLMNRNSRISIPEIETHFIPKILINDMSLKEAYKVIQDSAFVKGFALRGVLLPSFEDLKIRTDIGNSKDLIEYILKYYGSNGSKEWNNEVIWGDKTPLYLRYIEILKQAYHQARIIHIIRDPRDRAISVKKTWGKSMFRTTEKWRTEIEASRRFLDKDNLMIEVRYEDLVEAPEKTLTKICDFLSIPFQQEMLELEKPSEKHGENSKLLKVNKDNTAKYLNFPKEKIKRIEEIAGPLMEEFGYERKYSNQFKPYSPLMMELMKYPDFISYLYNNFKKGYNKP